MNCDDGVNCMNLQYTHVWITSVSMFWFQINMSNLMGMHRVMRLKLQYYLHFSLTTLPKPIQNREISMCNQDVMTSFIQQLQNVLSITEDISHLTGLGIKTVVAVQYVAYENLNFIGMLTHSPPGFFNKLPVHRHCLGFLEFLS